MKNEEVFRLVNDPDTQKLLNILRCKPTLEKTILAKELEISFQTLTKQINNLKQKNILKQNDI